MHSGTFLWHDYETFGRDPARDRPVQFAAIRTDSDLNELDEIMIYCRQTADYLPDPESCLVHGVLPQTANSKGLSEHEFATEVNKQMSKPDTCVVGYNNIRFDDEFTRQLFFRNLYDPYSREWKNGNTRWDLIDVVRLARALRPEGINWPCDDDGNPINKLEQLTRANDIPHGDAHDALADVRATIAIARLIKKRQPRLFSYALQMRTKKRAGQALDVGNHTPVLHVSGMYTGHDFNLSIVLPLCKHPTNANGVLAYDLRKNPADLIDLGTELIAERLFTSSSNLPDNTERIGIKTIHLNRCPALAPLSTLTDDNKSRLNLDLAEAMHNRDRLLVNLDAITAKLTSVFSHHSLRSSDDPELTLYSGTFASEYDRRLMEIAQQELTMDSRQADTIVFEDTRLNELYLRVRARNRPETLDESEIQRWIALCSDRVHQGQEGFRSISEYDASLEKMQAQSMDRQTTTLVRALSDYGKKVASYSRGHAEAAQTEL